MNLSLHIAKRYLFSKKSHNAINIISILSVCGIAVATMAMICALSVFNGFTMIATLTFSNFDPDLTISPAKGKVFDPTNPIVQNALKIEGIEAVSENLEENALLRYDERQTPILLKGISQNYDTIANIKKIIIDGEYVLRDGDFDFAIVGAGLASQLRIRPNALSPLEIYMPKRNERVNLANPSAAFVQHDAYTAGIFTLNQAKYDDQTLIVSIELVRELLRYENEVSTLCIKVKDGASIKDVQKQLQNLLGNDYKVKDRFEQQESTYKMVNIEKWVTYLILVIIVAIAAFNLVGPLSMLIIEKKEDISILQSMGADKKLICKIFMFEGWLITLVGVISGLVIGLVVCLLQQYLGLVKLGTDPGAFVIDAYPILVEVTDVIIVAVTVLLVGLLAVLYPVNVLRKKLQH